MPGLKRNSGSETFIIPLLAYAHDESADNNSKEVYKHGMRLFSAVKQINQHRRLVFLGDPGSGKSTFIDFVAMCMAGEILGYEHANLKLFTSHIPGNDDEKPPLWNKGALLPVCVTLRDLAGHGLPAPGRPARARDLWTFIVKNLDSGALGDYADQIKRELREDGGLLLLDGLDEVPDSDNQRKQIKQMVEDFASSYPKCRIVLTSRSYAYQNQGWRLLGFHEAMIAPFNHTQILNFVDAWCSQAALLKDMDSDEAKGRAEMLKKAIFGSERLISLAERPLLLTLMASLHMWRGDDLPEKREELYSNMVDLLLDQWQSQKKTVDIEGKSLVQRACLAEWLKVDRSKVRGLINSLAYRAYKTQPDPKDAADVSEKDLVGGLTNLNKDVKPKRLIEYLRDRAGILLRKSENVYTFPHRTFQEYLAACHLTDNDYPDLIAGLARNMPYRWGEVALLAGAKESRERPYAIWSLVDALCFRKPDARESGTEDAWGALLAGKALLESAVLDIVGEHNQAKLDLVRRWLAHLLTSLNVPAVE